MDNYADNIEKLGLDTMNSLLCSAISDSIPGNGTQEIVITEINSELADHLETRSYLVWTTRDGPNV